MKQLLQKLTLFFLMLLLIKIPFLFFYEDELAYRKSEFAKQEFDTIFIGSSRTKYAVIPAYFDSLTKSSSKSYNFGIASGLPPQTFDWCEEFIQNNPSLKNIIIELSGGIDQIPYYEEPVERFSISEYWRTLQLISFEKFATYHNQRAVGLFKPHISARYNDYNVPLENALEKKEIIAKKAAKPEKIEFTRRLNLQVENINLTTSSVNKSYWERVTKIIELAEAKQISIRFFIPPRIETEREFEMIYPIYQKLDKKYKLGAAHYDESLYRDNTSTDDFHLNHAGAMRFTEFLAEAFDNRNF